MTEPALSKLEPAAVAEGARWLLGVLAVLGWSTLDDDLINVIASAVAAVASVALTVWTRNRVTPTVKTGGQ